MKSSTDSSQEIKGPVLGEKVSPAPAAQPEWKPAPGTEKASHIEIGPDGKLRTRIPENGWGSIIS